MSARDDDSLVVAIYGPWGSGKSSLLNFVKHHVRRSGRSEALIIDFNPWWFSGEEDLTRRFFSELQRALGRRYGLRKVAKKVSGLAERLSEAPIPKAEYVKPAAWLLGRLGGQDDLQSLKEEVGSLLAENAQRLLVMIDDVDRLANEEIRQLFKLVKAVADFPHVTYVLALDKQVAIAALGEMQRISGEEYLEKIVQVPFELPIPKRATLQRVLFERLDELLADTPGGLFDQGHWANVYMDGIRHFIETPRDIVRYTNALRLTYAAVREEVNAVDFLAIHALSVFMPHVYDLIRKNPEEFAGAAPDRGIGDRDQDLAFHDAWLSRLPEERRALLKDFLVRLFPRLSAIWGNTTSGTSWLETWLRERRICSPDVFPIYFQFTVPEGGIGRVEMAALIELAHDEEAFASRLLDMAGQRRPEGGTRVAVALDRLLDHWNDEAVKPVAATMIRSVVRVGDELLRPEDEGGMLGLGGNDLRIARAVHRLVPHIDATDRINVLMDAFRDTPSLTTAVQLASRLAHFYERDTADGGAPRRPEDEPRLTESQLGQLKDAAVAEIRRVASADALLGQKNLPFVLYRWAEWAEEAEPRDWATRATQDDVALARLLESFVFASRSLAMGDWASTTSKRLDPNAVGKFIDINGIESRVEAMKSDERLTNAQREACGLFLRGMELIRAGRDPSNVLSWDRE